MNNEEQYQTEENISEIDLTIKQELAAQALVYKKLSQSEAYKQVFNVENMKPKSIIQAAWELFNKPKMIARVNELKEQELNRHKTTIDKIIFEYTKLAFYDPRNFFDDNNNIKDFKDMDEQTACGLAGVEISERDSNVTIKKIKMVDKKSALDSLAKYFEMFVNKVEITGKDGKDLPAMQNNVILTKDVVKQALEDFDNEY